MLKVGIAGYGIVGKRRRQYIDIHPNMQTVCVSDITFKNDGVFTDGVKYFKSYEKIFKENLDIVFVSLPNYLASDATIMGLNNGCHVFCEKPPARTVKEVRNIIKCSEKFPDLKLKYGFNHRYHDSVRKARNIIESKDLGEIVSFRGVYGKSSIVPFEKGWRAEKKYAGGGILLDQGIHMLDLVRYFSSDYEKIYSFVSNDYWKHNVEDNVFILMKNKMGQVASIHSTATQWQHRFRLEINMIEGLLELSGILSGSKSYGSETLKVIKRSKGDSSGAQDENKYTFLNDNSWKDEIYEFADCIVKDKPIINGTIDDALKVMEMIFKVYKSDKSWWQNFKDF